MDAQAQNNQIRGIKILEVENVKVYEVRTGKAEPTNLTRGKLLVFYFPEYDRFVLNLNSFEYALSPYLPVLASLTVDRGFRSYILPNIGGHYILKLKTTPIPAVIKNFETVLANYSQFSYESGQEKALQDQANRKGDYNMNFDSPYEGQPPHVNLETRKPQPDNFVKVENAVSLSGEFLKQKLIKAANYIGGNYIQPKSQVITEQNSNQFYVKNIQELKAVSAIDNELVDFKRTYLVALITLSNQIEKEGVANGTIIKPRVENKQQSNWSELGTTTLNSAKNVWFGMGEAATILGKAWKAKKTTENKNPVGKPVQYERVEPVSSRPNPFNYPSNTRGADYPISKPREQVQEPIQPYGQEEKPHVFYQPKYTQAPVIERQEDSEYSEFRDEGVSQGDQTLLNNEQDGGRPGLYPRLDTLNAGTYPSYNPYRVDARPSDATYARIHENQTQTGNHGYSQTDY